MTKSIVRHISLSLCALVASACLDTADPVEANFALLNMHSTLEGTEFRVSPVALFFRAGGVILPSSNRTQDICAEVAFPNNPQLENLDHLDAGPFVTATVSGTEATLLPISLGTVETYELGGGSIPINPGDTVEFTIPTSTAVLTATSGEAMTAEAFTPGDVTVVASSPDPTEFTWTEPEEDGSVMALELRFAASGGSEPDRELLCFLADDGSALISSALLTNFAASDLRLSKATRQRITTIEGVNTVMHITSTLEMPVTVNVTP